MADEVESPLAGVAYVTVARSWVQGVAGYEQPGSLERFREPFETALRAPSGG